MRDMKAKIFALAVMVLALADMAHHCLGQPARQVARPATLRRIDPLALQMQMAVLKDQDIQKVGELLKQGVNINAPIGCGTYGPLDGAVNTRNLDMLKFLLAHGAKPHGRELADAAFMGGDPQIALNFVHVLLSAGVDPNATNDYSNALSSAAYQGNREVVELLLAQPRIKVDAPDVDGYTALMWAAEHGDRDIVDSLLQAGADPSLKNRRGQTAEALADQGIATRQAIILKLQTKSN